MFPISKKDKKAVDILRGTALKKRPKRRKNNKSSKKPKIVIDHTEFYVLSKTDLPSDAVLKYYDEVIQQDVDLVRTNTLYKVAVYYSPSLNKTFRGVK